MCAFQFFYSTGNIILLLKISTSSTQYSWYCFYDVNPMYVGSVKMEMQVFTAHMFIILLHLINTITL